MPENLSPAEQRAVRIRAMEFALRWHANTSDGGQDVLWDIVRPIERYLLTGDPTDPDAGGSDAR